MPSSKKPVKPKGDWRLPLDDFLAAHNVGKWDMTIFGDGSGSGWDRVAGWAAITIDRETFERLPWTGSVNRGTVNFAEIMAYLQPLNWLLDREQKRREGGVGYRLLNVHIFTDSDYCRQVGAKPERGRKSKNDLLWSVFDCFKRQAIVLHWHWVGRDTVALNTYVDLLSKLASDLAKDYNPRQTAALTRMGTEAVDLYEVNPLYPPP